MRSCTPLSRLTRHLGQEPGTHRCLLWTPWCLAGHADSAAAAPTPTIEQHRVRPDMLCSYPQAIVAKAPNALQMEDTLGRKPVLPTNHDPDAARHASVVPMHACLLACVHAQCMHAIICATLLCERRHACLGWMCPPLAHCAHGFCHSILVDDPRKYSHTNRMQSWRILRSCNTSRAAVRALMMARTRMAQTRRNRRSSAAHNGTRYLMH